ncbi:DUF2812 domain-containing protein (plasmid) [Paraclostridium ghonii]|uniref:DUF2812 domain-containing protein n=1 Tax=Paraclostridium ghonii TaxID=29358 RepID=UPI00202CB1DB|nr:DUF2812 domain-containing protein [Paeniclostridium ghonii]MCM0165807.1 DUF2812 domain-containing protein [Paeniclostridium ghonii]
MNKSKIFFDIEKETKWLNTLSKKGYRLIDKKWFTYIFEPCENGAYIYQIERRKPFTYEKNKDYIDFISSLDINTVSTQWGWIYFEKENNGKEFNIFSDIPSKIYHYKNLIITLLIIGFISFSILASGVQGPYILNISFPLVANLVVILSSIFTIIKYLLKIHRLKKENSIIQ